MTTREQVYDYMPVLLLKLRSPALKGMIKGIEVSLQMNDGTLSAAETDRLRRLVEAANILFGVLDEDS